MGIWDETNAGANAPAQPQKTMGNTTIDEAAEEAKPKAEKTKKD